jgi:Family of unknown function (DUF6353)
MNFHALAKSLERVLVDNSTTILTGLGIAGAFTASYLSADASFKAADLLRETEEQSIQPLDLKEKVGLVWHLYIPAVGTLALSTAAIIGAHKIGARRTMALAAAYDITEKAFAEYKEKVAERLGRTKEQSVTDAIAQDKTDRRPPTEVIMTGRGEVLCYEAFSGRYFHSDVETLRKAMNDINHQILNSMYASLSDLYHLLGLPQTTYSDEVGWNCDKLLEIAFSATLSEENKPCIVVNFTTSPIRGYHRLM